MEKEKLIALFNDEAFVKELAAQETAEGAQKVFAAKGVTISIDELNALRVQLKQQAGEALSDEELEMAAGGQAAILGAHSVIGTLPPDGDISSIISQLHRNSFGNRW